MKLTKTQLKEIIREELLNEKMRGLSPNWQRIQLEDVLWIFTDPKKAVMATMKLKSEITKYNETKNANEQIKISGYGIHTGEMIFIEGTDIHWGDPVNTSSKLGQDLANDGEFLITPVVYNAIKEDAEVVQTYSFFEKMLKRSNVDFLCYLVKHKVQEATVEKIHLQTIIQSKK